MSRRFLLAVSAAAALPCAVYAQQPAPQSAAAPAAAQSAPAAPAAPAAPTGPVLTVTFKDGKAVTTGKLSRKGDNLMVTVQLGAGLGEVGYPLSAVASINFPEPPQLKTATDLMTRGKPAEAIAQLEPVVTYYAPFRDVPGSWWTKAAGLKLNALVALGRDKEAESLIVELSRASDPEVVRAAKVQQAASWTRKGEHDKALAVYDAIIAESKSRDTLAQAWLNKGQSLLATSQWEPALLAYLHVPVFYGDQKLLMPQAMLGSARALVGLDSADEAQKRFQELIESYPGSAETTAAKAELAKLQKQKP